LIYNGNKLLEEKGEKTFNHSFELYNHSIEICLLDKKFKLLIDEKLFDFLANLEKNKIVFLNKNRPVSNVIWKEASDEAYKNKLNFGVGVVNNELKENEKLNLFNFKIKPINSNIKMNLSKYSFLNSNFNFSSQNKNFLIVNNKREGILKENNLHFDNDFFSNIEENRPN